MKKIYLYLLFILVLTNNSQSIDLKPIFLDYYGGVVNDSITLVYGNYGSCQISRDGDKTWETKKIFDKGIINKVFIESNRIVAFRIDGAIAVSYDYARTWNIVAKIDIGINDYHKLEHLNIINTDYTYFIRTYQNIYKVSKDFKVEKKIDFKFPSYLLFNNIDLYKVKSKSLLFKNNELFAFLDTFDLKILDLNLNVVKTINLKDKINCTICHNSLNLYSINDNIVVQYACNFYELNNNYNVIKETFIENCSYSFDAINNEILIQNKEDLIKTNITNISKINGFTAIKKGYYINYSVETNPSMFMNIYFNKNKLVITHLNNTITILKLNNSLDSVISANFISNGSYRNLNFTEFEVINNQLFTFNKSDGYSSDITTLTINDNKQELIVNANLNKIFNSPFYGNPYHKYVDKNGYVYFGGRVYFGESYVFKFNRLDTLCETIKLSDNILPSNFEVNSFKKYNNEFIFHMTQNYLNSDISYLRRFDTLFKYIGDYKFENNYTYIYDIDALNKITLLSSFDVTSDKIIKFTLDTGKTWNEIYNYGSNSQILQKEFFANNTDKFWLLIIFDNESKKLKLDKYDLNTNKLFTLFDIEIQENQLFDLDKIWFTYSDTKIYFSFLNKLFVFNNINSSSFQEYIFPNNGNIKSKMYVYGKTLLARYEDDRNEDNFYWINGIDLVGPPSSVENNIEEVNFLFLSSPYPNPTTNSITIRIYWDSSIDLNIENIGIYDIMGNKINSNDNIRLEKFNNYSGNVVWDTSNQPKGTYLLKIQHGNNTKSVKIMVE